MSTKGFTDSIEGNLAILQELIGQLPPRTRQRAREAGATIERAMNSLRVNGGENDPGTTLGLALAAHAMAHAITKSAPGEGLIELLQ